jgi:signal transduction histidine kinase
MLSRELLKELRDIVREDFGEELDDEELFEFGENLLSYFELLAKISSREYFGEDDQKLKDRIEFDSLTK